MVLEKCWPASWTLLFGTQRWKVEVAREPGREFDGVGSRSEVEEPMSCCARREERLVSGDERSEGTERRDRGHDVSMKRSAEHPAGLGRQAGA